MSVQALRCPAVTTGHNVRAVRRDISGQLRSKSRPMGVISTLLGLLCSSMSAEPPPKSRDKRNKVCSQQPGKPVSSLHPVCPQPHRGDERQRPHSELAKVLNIRKLT